MSMLKDMWAGMEITLCDNEYKLYQEIYDGFHGCSDDDLLDACRIVKEAVVKGEVSMRLGATLQSALMLCFAGDERVPEWEEKQ